MEEKSMKKSFSSLGFRFLIGTLVIYAVQMGVMTIVGAVKPEWLQDTTISLILAVFTVSCGYAGSDRCGKADARGSTREEKHYTGTVCSGADHVFCTDVLW